MVDTKESDDDIRLGEARNLLIPLTSTKNRFPRLQDLKSLETGNQFLAVRGYKIIYLLQGQFRSFLRVWSMCIKQPMRVRNDINSWESIMVGR